MSISALPIEIRDLGAVEICYGAQIDLAYQRLTQRYRVLIRCEKGLNAFLYPALRNRIRRSGTFEAVLIDGRPGTDDEGLSRAQVMLNQLTQFMRGGVTDQHIAFLTHLDLLSTSGSTPNPEAREVIPLLYEHPYAKLCALVDPSFPLPPALVDVFDVRIDIVGIPRNRLSQLITQREARALHHTRFDPYLLYPYVSGLSAVRARRVLSMLAERPEVSPLSTRAGQEALRALREQTAPQGDGVELPQVDLHTDIAGYDLLKERIERELINLALARLRLSDPADIELAESLTPRGALFYGPPGTGKTFFAKAIATALQASLIVISGPELKSKWVGESEENLRRVFRKARATSPTVIVFDEIDSFAQARGSYQTSGVEHSMVNQLLTEMDGFKANEQVFIIATTNFLSSVDSALLRPGRFELLIEIPAPDELTRASIITHYNARFKLGMSPELITWTAQQTSGPADTLGHPFTADHLQALCRALKREQLLADHLTLTQHHILDTLNRDRPAMTLTEDERRVVATHECGHALLALILPRLAPPSRVSIRPDSMSLGRVQRVQNRAYLTYTMSDFRDEVCMNLGGIVAEELCFGEHSVGGSLDLAQATAIAKELWGRYGMAKSSQISYYGPRGEGFTRGEVGLEIPSDEARTDAERWSHHFISTERSRALDLLTNHRQTLEALTEQLLEQNELSDADLKRAWQKN